MKEKNEKLMDQFRDANCEICGDYSGREGVRNQPHHLITRGHGGGRRMDIPENLIGLCPRCHLYAQGKSGRIKELIWAIVARRNKKTVEELEQLLHGKQHE